MVYVTTVLVVLDVRYSMCSIGMEFDRGGWISLMHFVMPPEGQLRCSCVVRVTKDCGACCADKCTAALETLICDAHCEVAQLLRLR